MEDINSDKNNINDNEIELSENFMSNDNNKNLKDYSLIPSNYGKITNINTKNPYNLEENLSQNIREISQYSWTDKFYILLANLKKLYFQLSFNWCYEIIKKGKKSKLTISSFKKIPSNYLAKELFNNIYPIWQNNIKTNKKRSYIMMKILLKIHFKKLLLVSFLLLINTLLDFGGIIVFNELLKRFNNDKKNDDNSLFNLNQISLLKLTIYMMTYAPVTFIIFFQSSYLCDLINLSANSQLNCLIYDKVLKMATYVKTNFNQGKIINLIQSDSEKFGNLISSYPEIFSLPLKILYSVLLLFKFYGYTFIPCLIILTILFFLFYFFGKKQNEYENALVEVNDKKMNLISQTFNIIKIIKLYVWEKLFIKKIEKVKEEENIIMRKKANMTLIVNSSYWNTEAVLILITVIFYFLKYHNLDNSNLLTTMFIFYHIIDPLYSFPGIITNLNDTFISLRRIENFLGIQEHDKSQLNYLDNKSELSIEINDINFGVYKSPNYKEEENTEDNKKDIKDNKEISDDKDDENDAKLLEQDNDELIKIKLLKDIRIKINKGEHIAVIGKVGSGKSCLLNSFLNNLAIIKDDENKDNYEIIKESADEKKLINVSGKISYVTQNPWILNDTFRNNILFFNKMDENKYNKIISICQLEPDLKIINGGDKAEIGEKGINLSGGQKIRLTIARAVYSDAEIYIFDDPLSALDAYVGMNLFKEVFCNYLQNKTVIISTHSLQFLNMFDRVIFMEDGKIKWFGPSKEIINQPFYEEFSKIIKNNNNDIENNKKEKNDNEKSNYESISSEESSTNEIIKVDDDNFEENRKYFYSFLFFLEYSGGISFCIKVLLSNIIWKLSQLLSDFYISKWAKEGIILNKNEIYFKLFVFITISFFSIFGVIARQKLMDDGLIRYNIRMHSTLLDKLIHASLNLFHNITPKGKIYNLLKRELEDSSSLNLLLSRYLRNIFQVISSIIICITFNKWSIILILLIFYIEYLITSFYLPSSKEINNLEENSRTPIIGVFEETLSGIPIIRSIQYEQKFINKYYDKINDHFMVSLYQNGIFYWLIIHLNIISNILSAFILTICYLFKSHYDSQSLGLLLKYSILLSDQLFEIMIGINEFGKTITSVSRCKRYTKIVQEKFFTNESKFEKNINANKGIFSEGKIQFENYNVKYGPKDPLVLKNINLEIHKGEKIGVVGRTGSGKTTLSLCLFRILEADSGKILIDDIDISKIDLFSLRENISIIPQEPTLIEDTLKNNIDPYHNYSDSEINKLIYEIGLDVFMSDKTLDYKIEENGNNLSVGERQLICIARAFLKKNKIIVMDEATSSIDFKTENIIQNAIANLMKFCTVITIAHRIKTIINYDKILVMSNGEIAEFDTPQNLLNKKGLFYLLYKESISSSS